MSKSTSEIKIEEDECEEYEVRMGENRNAYKVFV
jgi:hypothetical protein